LFFFFFLIFFVFPSPKNTRESMEAPVVECFTERREIHVATSATDKTASKAFTFDRVFGPETSQSQVYEEVVHPLIEEVIMGYNCTIFAYVTPLSPSLSLPVCWAWESSSLVFVLRYGQTGTGKTHTMEGSNWDNDEISIEDNPGAGIIPRVLHNLFRVLPPRSPSMINKLTQKTCSPLRFLTGSLPSTL